MKVRTIITVFLSIALAFTMATSSWAGAVRGVTDKEVKIAWLVDLSGPGKAAGPALVAGGKDYVAYINDQGGIHGRKINLIVEDNGLLPNTNMVATRKVIFKDEIFAIGFLLGSSAASAVLPLCEENKIVMLPHGANKKFYYPGNKWVFVPHTTQYGMACRAIEYIYKKNPKARIGIIYRDDGFGREGVEGARAAAKFLKTEIVKTAPYRTGTIDVSPQMSTLKQANVDFIVTWSTLGTTAAILKIKAKMGWDVPVLASNTNNHPVLFALLKEKADGMLLVSPYAAVAANRPGIKRMIEINKKYGNYPKELGNPMYADYMYLAAAGYIIAAVEGLKNAGRDLTPESYVKGLESVKNYDMGGMCPNLTFGPKQHVSSFSSLIMRADAKKKQFVVEAPLKEPKTPQY